MHMHLHTVHQTPASMEGHIYNARMLGMEYIRFTDHDTHTGISDKSISSFDFTRGVLEYENEAGVTCGWTPLYECVPTVSCGKLTLTSQGERAGVQFCANEKRHNRALLADVTLTLTLDHKLKAGSRIVIDILLSMRPPEHKEAHFLYVLGETVSDTGELVGTKDLEPRPDGIYRLELSRDIGERTELGGLDNAFRGVSVILDGEGEVSLSGIQIDSVYQYDELVRRQRTLADEIGKRYGVKPFVTTEISGAGQHKNCYSSHVPVLDYSKGRITSEQAVKHVLSHGGIFCYNHPFESSKYKRKPFTREELDEIVEFESLHLAECRVFGASVIEIGFPMGRGLFTIGDYLRLWDNLSLAGVFITADGDSDSHTNAKLWLDRNNFATWIGIEEDLRFPIGEEVFNASLKKGNAYTGDPVFLRGEVSFTCLGAPMGSVIEAYGKEYPLSLSLSGIVGKYTVRIIENGHPVLKKECEGDCNITYTARPSGRAGFVRAEAYNESGRCILLTNPIYFVSPDFDMEIPEERKVKL